MPEDHSSTLLTVLRNGATETVREFHGLLWPAVCVSCRRGICEQNGQLCNDCWQQLQVCVAGEYCPRCGRDVSAFGLVNGACPDCLGSENHFDQIARAGVYTGTLQKLVLTFKHGRTELDAVLGPLVKATFEGSRFYQEVDVIVPVPLHWTRRLIRGYNQAHLLAGKLKHPRAKVCTDLVRVRRTSQQPMMATAAARARNVAGAFAVRSDHRFEGKVCCLIDDIKTTGSTLNECAKALKAAGAKKVHALVLAVAGQRPG